jgi:hypothetical protein
MKKVIPLLVLYFIGLAACHSEKTSSGVPSPMNSRPAETMPGMAPAAGLTALQQFTGKTPQESGLWATEPLNKRLSALLEKKYKTLQTNLQVATPLREENGVLFVTGSRQAKNSGDVAAVVIDPKQDLIFVWMKSGGRAEEFQENNQTLALPREVLKLMTGAKK